MDGPLIDVTVSSRESIAQGIVQIELVAPDGADLPAFTAGSHIDVHLGEGLVRQYSLCNDPSETHRYRLGVQKEPDGRGGSAAAHELSEGSTLKISAPRNNFELDGRAKRHVLVAGGIGITPLLSMAQALLASGQDFVLHYCTRSQERMAFRTFLEQPRFCENVVFHFDDGPEGQRFDIAALSAEPEDGTHLYVCGPTGFMDAVLAATRDHWPTASVHREYFTVEAAETDGEERPFRIQIGDGGDILDVPADRSIVDVLADAGIEIPTSCEQGICGTCLTQVLQGTPDHRDLVLTEEEHAENDQMTLCCSRARSDLLVLDL